MKKYYTAVALTALFASQTNAQFSEGGLPWSMRHQLDAAVVPVVRTAGIDRTLVDDEDARRAEEGLVPSDARMLVVDADLETSGVWHTLPNGDGVWRLRVESPGALATELFFQEFHMPVGGLLHVYTPDGSEVLGGFSGYHNKESGIFATAALKGDACYVEYYEPAAVRGEGRFIIATLGHTYRRIGPERADACEVDVNCPEGVPWVPQRDAVVKLRIVQNGQIFFCSGSLVNNTAQDCKRLVLTAMHCGVGVSDADLLLWKFYFGYQRPNCGTGSASQSRIRTGCFKRGESNDNGGDNGSDFLLLEIEDEISPTWNPYWLGWDATTNTHTGGICIHHPAGDEKKISTFTGNAQNSTQWNGMSTHYRVIWSGTESGWGVTEGGSSGSPLFDSNGRVIGTLTGGSSCCVSNGCDLPGSGPSAPDFYGRMNYHWTSNPGPSSDRLKTWLDPDNTGTLTLDGSYNPCSQASVAEFATLERPRITPNPATEHVRITFPTSVAGVERVDVLDIAGKVIASQAVANAAGSVTLSVQDLASGTYFARLSTEDSFLPAVLFEVVRQ